MSTPAEPLEVERLATDDERRLEVATAAARPIPAGTAEELLEALRRLEAEAEEARADELETHETP